MTVNRKYVWAGGALAAVLLIFFWRWGAPERKPNVQRSTADPAIAREVTRIERQTHRHAREEECAACPDLPLPPAIVEKRTGEEDLDLAEQFVAALGEFASQLGGCDGLLMTAVVNGNPNPNTSLLGGCDGQTPLHMPTLTPELVQNLIDAGADVNAQDDFGRTPLHVQSVLTPGSQTLPVIELLLQSGADPLLKDELGNAPWKTARQSSSIGIGHLVAYEKVEKQASEMGLTVEAYLDSHPRQKAHLEGFLDRYLESARIKRLLLDAAAEANAAAKSAEALPESAG